MKICAAYVYGSPRSTLSLMPRQRLVKHIKMTSMMRLHEREQRDAPKVVNMTLK